MPTINQLNNVDTPNASDLLPIFSQQNGDARSLSLANLMKWMQSLSTSASQLQTQYAAPSATGFTAVVTDSSNSTWLILTPTGAFAAGTIKLPSKAASMDGQEVVVNTTQAVTVLTVDGNESTITGAPTTLAANAFFRLRYDAVMSTWYRIG